MARLEQLVDIEVLGHLVYPHFILPMKFKVGNAGCVRVLFFFFFLGGGWLWVRVRELSFLLLFLDFITLQFTVLPSPNFIRWRGIMVIVISTFSIKT